MRLGRRVPFLTALGVGLAAGFGYPLVDLALACRVPVAEACVWGKAYLPLTLGVSVVLLGGPLTGLLCAGLRWLHRSRDDADQAATRPGREATQ